MTELWKDIQGYEGLYQVSNMGRVRSLDHETVYSRRGVPITITRKGQILSPVTRQHGYLGVMLYGKGGHKTRGFKTFSVHQLVAKAFVDNPNNFEEVNHLDEDKTNNRADNLEWCDRKYNTNYGTTQARRSAVIRNSPKRSKRVMQIDQNGEIVKIWPSFGELGRNGYSTGNINSCCNGTRRHAYGYTWRYAD